MRLKPIREQLKADKFRFDESCVQAWNAARDRLIEYSKVAHIDYGKEFHIRIDTATGNSIGAVLYQKSDEGIMVPLMYKSRKLTGGECRYSPTDAEMSGVHWAITHAFRDIIEYAPIVIMTDHKNLLTTLGTDTATSNRRLKWAFNLGFYNIVDTVHVPGEQLVDADKLSRATYQEGDAMNANSLSKEKVIANMQKFYVAAIEDAAGQELIMSKGTMRSAQKADRFCRSIVKVLTCKNPVKLSVDNRIKHIAAKCKLNKDLLMYKDIVQLSGQRNVWKCVLPEKLVKGVIKAVHEQEKSVADVSGVNVHLRMNATKMAVRNIIGGQTYKDW